MLSTSTIMSRKGEALNYFHYRLAFAKIT